MHKSSLCFVLSFVFKQIGYKVGASVVNVLFSVKLAAVSHCDPRSGQFLHVKLHLGPNTLPVHKASVLLFKFKLKQCCWTRWETHSNDQLQKTQCILVSCSLLLVMYIYIFCTVPLKNKCSALPWRLNIWDQKQVQYFLDYWAPPKYKPHPLHKKKLY